MELLSPISSAVMAIIWIIYLQLFFVQYRRNNRPYLVFHHAQNDNPDALCLLVNMSELAVHIQTVQATVYFRDAEPQIITVTQLQSLSATENNVQQQLRQGPLQSGDYLVLGSFKEILCGDQTEETMSRELEKITGLELRVAVIHGPSRFPVGARRSFIVQQEKTIQILPTNIHTEQLSRKKDQKRVRQWIERDLNPVRKGSAESDSSSQEELSENK